MADCDGCKVKDRAILGLLEVMHVGGRALWGEKWTAREQVAIDRAREALAGPDRRVKEG